MKPANGNPDAGPNGRPWPKGVSGNPGGRPRGYNEFKAKCRKHSDEAIAALAAALSEPGERVPAAKVILEYSWGRPEKRQDKPVVRRSGAVPSAEEAAAAVAELRALNDSH